MKKLILYSVVIITLFGIVIGLTAFTQFGNSPSLEDSIMYESSPGFHNGTFINSVPVTTNIANFGVGKFISFFLDSSREPDHELPRFHLTSKSFPEIPADLQLTWLGHSSTILDIDAVRVLIDPVFGNASPVPFTIRRFQPSPIKREELPDLDAVVISHDHYDHLEMKTIKFLKNRVKLFIVPLGVGRHLMKWGCSPEQIVELDWGKSHQIKGVTITATPSRHFSGRGIGDRNTTQWASYVFKGPVHSAFYSGDGGYDGRFKAIGEKYGPFDLTLIENGAWDQAWKDVHLLPHQSVQAHIELRGKYMLPVHWGSYDLAFHKWDEPILITSKIAKERGVQLLTPQMGEICIPGTTSHSAWWNNSREPSLAASKQ